MEKSEIDQKSGGCQRINMEETCQRKLLIVNLIYVISLINYHTIVIA